MKDVHEGEKKIIESEKELAKLPKEESSIQIGDLIFSSGKGTKIENSVVMLDVTVGRNVILNYAVIDDNSTIHDARALSGYVTHPFFCAAKTTI